MEVYALILLLTCIVKGVVVFPMENLCPSTVHTEIPNAERSYLCDLRQKNYFH